MSLWIVWLIVAVALIVIEVTSQTLWALCLAIGALAAMAAALAGGAIASQLIFLAVATLVAYLALLPLAKRWQRSHPGPSEVRTGMDALLGRVATVTHEIRPGEMGRARIDGDNWQVRAPGVDVVIPRGAEVSVTSYHSIILDVTPKS